MTQNVAQQEELLYPDPEIPAETPVAQRLCRNRLSTLPSPSWPMRWPMYSLGFVLYRLYGCCGRRRSRGAGACTELSNLGVMVAETKHSPRLGYWFCPSSSTCSERIIVCYRMDTCERVTEYPRGQHNSGRNSRQHSSEQLAEPSSRDDFRALPRLKDGPCAGESGQGSMFRTNRAGAGPRNATQPQNENVPRRKGFCTCAQLLAMRELENAKDRTRRRERRTRTRNTGTPGNLR